MTIEEENKKLKFFLMSLLLKCEDLSEENRKYTMSFAVEEDILKILNELSALKSE